MRRAKRAVAVAAMAACIGATQLAPAVAGGSDSAIVVWNAGSAQFVASTERLSANDDRVDGKFVRARLWHNGSVVAIVTDEVADGYSAGQHLNLPRGTYQLQMCLVWRDTWGNEVIGDCSNHKPVYNA